MFTIYTNDNVHSQITDEKKALRIARKLFAKGATVKVFDHNKDRVVYNAYRQAPEPVTFVQNPHLEPGEEIKAVAQPVYNNGNEQPKEQTEATVYIQSTETGKTQSHVIPVAKLKVFLEIVNRASQYVVACVLVNKGLSTIARIYPVNGHFLIENDVLGAAFTAKAPKDIVEFATWS